MMQDFKLPECFRCPSHGNYSSDKDNCPTCVAENRAAEVSWNRAWSTHTRWLNSGIPHRYRTRTLQNWEPQNAAQTDVLLAAKSYAANLDHAYDAGRGVIALGGLGVGKTHLLAGVLHCAVACGYSALFVRAGDLFADMKRAYAKDAAAFDDEPLRNVDFLLIDDVGANLGSAWEIQVLHEIFAHRYDKTVPTLITSNVSDLDSALGPRIADRLVESGLRLTIAGTSRRKAAAMTYYGNIDAISEPPNTLALEFCERVRMRQRAVERSR